MKCENIMSTNLEWLSEHDTVQTAATRMAEAGVGFLPICDADRRIIGVSRIAILVTRGIAGKVGPGTTSASATSCRHRR